MCCLGEVQDLLSRVLQLVGVRGGSPTLVTTGPCFSLASSINEWKKGHFSPAPVAARQMGNGDSCPTLMIWELAHPHLPWQG